MIKLNQNPQIHEKFASYPQSIKELLDLSQKNYLKLYEFMESMDKTEEEKEFPEGTMNRNITNLLAHLYDWHLMLIEWYRVGMAGEKPEMPAKGYS